MTLNKIGMTWKSTSSHGWEYLVYVTGLRFKRGWKTTI